MTPPTADGDPSQPSDVNCEKIREAAEAVRKEPDCPLYGLVELLIMATLCLTTVRYYEVSCNEDEETDIRLQGLILDELRSMGDQVPDELKERLHKVWRLGGFFGNGCCIACDWEYSRVE